MVGGPYAAIGVAVASVAAEAVSLVQKVQTYDLEKNLENETIRQNLIRAGAGGSRRNE